jgi:hypothetical protein
MSKDTSPDPLPIYVQWRVPVDTATRLSARLRPLAVQLYVGNMDEYEATLKFASHVRFGQEPVKMLGLPLGRWLPPTEAMAKLILDLTSKLQAYTRLAITPIDFTSAMELDKLDQLGITRPPLQTCTASRPSHVPPGIVLPRPARAHPRNPRTPKLTTPVN